MNQASAEPRWISALVAMVVVQVATAFMTRVAPTIAPLLTAEFSWSDAVVGYLASINTVGSIAFLIAGAPLLRRLGPIRSLQTGLSLGIVGLAFLLSPIWPLAAVGAFLVGLGYGPSSPAGSEVLHRLAPARRRGMIFSIKQAGVPIGGTIAGLALPPIAEAYGWRLSLLFSALLVAAIMLAVQPMQRELDAARSPDQPLSVRAFLSLQNLLEPMRALKTSPSLLRIAMAGMGLAFGQGIWFAYLVTFAVSELKFDLTSAGLAFAAMQGMGVFGRILLGWLADQVQSGLRLLAIIGGLSGLTSLAMMFARPDWPVWLVCLLAGIAGITVSSWNGVQLSEVARRAAPGLVREASSGATVVIFLGYVVGPLVFALFVGLVGRFDLGFLVGVLGGLSCFLILATYREGDAEPGRE